MSAQVLALELTANPAQMPVLWNMSVSNWLRICKKFKTWMRTCQKLKRLKIGAAYVRGQAAEWHALHSAAAQFGGLLIRLPCPHLVWLCCGVQPSSADSDPVTAMFVHCITDLRRIGGLS